MAKLIRILAGLYLLALLFFAWGFAAVRFEVFPYGQLQPLVDEVTAFFAESHQEKVADIVRFDHQERRNSFDFSGLRVVDESFREDGYLLISRYSKAHGQTVVELLELARGEVRHTWVPDLDAIFALTPNHRGGVNTPMAYRSQHPLLMDNGDLVLTSGEGPLVRIDRCGRPRWAVDRHFHHSIEQDSEGNLVVPIVLAEGPDANGIPARDDGFAVVSPEGEILAEYAISEALLDNGYQGLIYGVGVFEADRYHLNDVQPLAGKAAADGVLLSIRNLSSVALFIPATGEIPWLRTGPWLNQHDINELGDGRYSIFGNELVRGPEKIIGTGHSRVYTYRPDTGEVATPYDAVLRAADMRTPYEGRVEILANGDAFIEETNRDRILRLSPEGVRWEYVNGISATTTGALHWSRYLGRATFATDWLENIRCD
ncbi:MAG: arylsulfotransferase family protein [Porticoccaceae bacterium]|jgi:hypothetical protein|nr:arylsulfotransferase family protein [Pseudomonadota bacterium]